MKSICAAWIVAGSLAFGYQGAPVPAAASAGPATASIEGQVFNATTGAPLKKATVRLTGLGPRPAGGMPTILAKETDDQGRFAFAALDTGRYQLAAERLGFLRQGYGARKYSSGGTPIVLAADQHMRDVVFRLSPQSVITGKVLDEDGDPVANVQVRVLKFQYQGGKKTWVQVGGAQTSDIGEYRLPNLDPGRYVVGTSSRNPSNMTQSASNEPLPKNPDMFYAVTYYPSAMDSTSAAPVEVGPGGEVRGIDIRMRKAPVFRIRGKVANATAPRVSVHIVPKEGGPMLGNAMASAPDYRFEIRGISPGQYVLQAQMGNGNQQAVAFQEVQVANQHVEGLLLAVATGGDVRGSVKVEDTTTPVPLPNLSVYLRPEMPIGASPRAKAGDDLNFTLRNVVPLHYSIAVSGTPENCYVKSIRYGGQPVPDEGVDIQANGVIDVILSATAGEVDGAVVDKEGKPVAGALVGLYSKGAPAGALRSSTTDEKGAVVFKGLKPGDYTLIGWEDIPHGASQDPEFVKLYERRGESVKLDASARQAIQLKVIPAEETDK